MDESLYILEVVNQLTHLHPHCENPAFLDFLNEMIEMYAQWHTPLNQRDLVDGSNDSNFVQFVKTLISNSMMFPCRETIRWNNYVLELKWNRNLCMWNGYITIPDKIFSFLDEEKIREIVDKTFHKGISYETHSKYGMDCSHSGDYHFHPLFFSSSRREIYRTKDFVLNCLRNAADALEFVSKEVMLKSCHK
jgi:hypothetical protein